MTQLAHLGEEEKILGAVVPPIFQNSLFLFDRCEDLHHALSVDIEGPPYHYSRISNPSVELAEKKIAALEGAEACKLTGTGQAALTMAIISATHAGAHVVAVDTCYGPVRSLLQNTLSRFGVTFTLVDGSDTQELLDAIRPETSAVYLESPSSILFRLQDVDAITKETRARGITTIFDNTYNTPLHYNPIAHGVDVVCHSATKYLGGHSDLTAGVLCTDEERMDSIVRHELNYLGSILSPFAAWLLVRGLRTLPLRLKRHEETANVLANWLADRPEIDRLFHVGHPSHPHYALGQASFRGTGGLFSFIPKTQDRDKACAFCDSLRLFGRGVSWGGFESLAIPLQMQALSLAEPTWIVRIFAGLEDADDLLRDIEQAMPHLAA